MTKARAEIEAQGLTLETWPKQATIWERIAESKGYCQNYGVRWHVRDERVTWDVKERHVSDILGPEGAEYRALLTRELEQASTSGTGEWLEKMGIRQNAQTQNQDRDQTTVQNDEYRALLTRELEQAEQQRRQAKKAEDRAMQALEAERAKYQWLVDYSCGGEV